MSGSHRSTRAMDLTVYKVPHSAVLMSNAVTNSRLARLAHLGAPDAAGASSREVAQATGGEAQPSDGSGASVRKDGNSGPGG
jgi:hypothetical protein